MSRLIQFIFVCNLSRYACKPELTTSSIEAYVREVRAGPGGPPFTRGFFKTDEARLSGADRQGQGRAGGTRGAIKLASRKDISYISVMTEISVLMNRKASL